MADIILSPVLQVIFDRLASPILQTIGDMFGFEDNLKRLQDSLSMVQAILEDAEEEQVTRKAVKIWLSRLRDAALDTEDLLDHLAARGIEYAVQSSKAADQVRKVLQALETTAKEGLSLNLRDGSGSDVQYDRRETSSFAVGLQVYGREDDREKIVGQLLTCEATQEGYPTVIPIIGIGGIGKTTLAQLAYSDERVTRCFDVKIWVFVSEKFDVKRVMRTVIESVTDKICKFTGMDALQSKLWSLLQRKKYLIVLDDAWSEDEDEWDKLRPLFRGGDVGSKIMITTRSKKVAMVMNSPTYPYNLKGLDADDCWALFKQMAFQRGEEDKYPSLLPIGKQIVKRCGGLPLAAKTLGSSLRLKREEREWMSVENSELWSSSGSQGGILPSLMLSYHHLPTHLKHCFAFCSIFPKAYVIEKEKLIHLWMAAGLIPQGNRSLEETGNEYFNDFLWMSFFQEAEKCENDSITGYRMHDIVHDLARYVAGKEFVMLDHCCPSSSLAQVRHSSVVCKFGSFAVPEALYDVEHLRTLLLIVAGDLEEVPAHLVWRFKYLRVLDLNSCGLTELHESIGSLFCLRYLDLSYTYITALPETIQNLSILQTLNLRGCFNLEQFPDLRAMKDLRHLIVTGCINLTLPLKVIKHMKLLQITLSVYNCGQPFTTPEISDLEHLNLCGELIIKGLEKVIRTRHARLACLEEKNLESLGLCWGEGDGDTQSHFDVESVGRFKPDMVEDILQALKPNQNLRRLLIEGYPGKSFPQWILPNLLTVNLTNCRKCERLPILGNHVLLKTLSLSGMDAVKSIGEEIYGQDVQRPFPSLEELILRGFPNLVEWSTGNAEDAFSKLRLLTVDNCPKLTTMPRFRSLQHLVLRDCNQVILSVANTTSLSTLVIERIAELRKISGSFLATNTLLTSLEIISCPNLHFLPSEIGSLTNLKSLTIRWCEELMSLPHTFHNLRALESLEISECHSMISIPDNELDGLSSLKALSIENCNNLTSLPSNVKHLSSLEHLTIMYCPSLVSVPEGLRHLSTLQSLTILSCPQFSSLPEELRYVKTLRCLEIHSCPGLTALPEWIENLTSLRSLKISDCPEIKYLPESLKRLDMLQHLSIQDCPKLEERTKEENGEDWHKIAHIPHKHIGSVRFAKSTVESNSNSGPESSSSRPR